jgi:deazaflavin-dependent oxidoreductase (nitroreductase family)
MMRAPVALDRPGLRWLLNLFSPAPIVVVVHRGRRSGKIHRTPVEAIAGNEQGEELVISPVWGERTDWYRNVLAGGLVEVRLSGEGRRVEWRELSGAERLEAASAYRRDHPLYGGAVLRILARLHGLDGDPVQAVARALPMLALDLHSRHRVAPPDTSR